MTLYELSDAARSLYELLEAGDIDERTYTDTLESIGADEKADAYCRIIRQLQADAKALKEERDRLDARRKAAEAAIDRMKAALLEFTQACGGKVKTPLFSISTRVSYRVEVTRPEVVPEQYLIPQPPKGAVSEISKALKAGEDVEGALLIESHSVIIK